MTRPAIAARLIPAWLDACCEQHPNHFERAGILYRSWCTFAHIARAQPGSTAEFATVMEAMGFECDQLKGERHRIRWGLRLHRRANP